MTRRERVINALEHRETDALPYQINFTTDALNNMIAHTGSDAFLSTMGNHMCRCYGNEISEPTERAGYFRDHFGVIWNRSGLDKDVGIVDNVLLPEAEIGDYRFPTVDPVRFRKKMQDAMKGREDRFVTSNIKSLLFERAWMLRGMEDLLMDMVCEPEFVHELMENICQFQLQIIDLSLEFPIDGFYFGDDYGQQKGLIMGPKYWREFIKPYLKRIVHRIKDAGKYAALHSCGDISEILPDLIEIGLDAYQTVQPEIYDLKELKRNYGKDITFWGAISTQRDLPFASPDELRRVIQETCRIMRPGGGFILAPTHSLPADIPPENILAMIEEFQRTDCF